MTIAVEIEYLAKMNWSLARAGIPVIRSLRLTNRSAAVRSVTLRVRIPRFCDSGELVVADLEPGQPREVELSGAFVDNFDLAVVMPYPLRTYVVVSADNAHLRFPVELLMPDEWMAGVALHNDRLQCDSSVAWCAARGLLPPGGVSLPAEGSEEQWQGVPALQAAVASLVMPQHPLVEDVRVQGQIALGRPFNECSADDVMRAVFEQLAPRMLFPDIERYGLEQRSQRIRLPHELLAPREGPARGGTCIDWALLMVAALEACGRSPLLLLVELAGHTMHALVGCWKSDPVRGLPLITDAFHIGTLLNRSMAVVDVMEAARGGSWIDALERADSLLRGRESDARFVYAVDIELARGREGGANACRIPPLPYERKPLQPERPTAGLEPDLSALEESVEFRAGSPTSAPPNHRTVEHLSAQAVLEEKWAASPGRPLVLICDFAADVRTTLQALVDRGRMAEREIEAVEPARSLETLGGVLHRLETRLGHGRTAPAVIVIDLSEWSDLGDVEALWSRVAVFWAIVAPWDHWLVIGLPRSVAFESAAYEDLYPHVYCSAPLFAARYRHRSAFCQQQLPAGVLLGPTLVGLLSLNSPAAARLFLDAIPSLDAGVLEPTADNADGLKVLTALAARFMRAGFHEIAYRLELACATACAPPVDLTLAADVTAVGATSDHLIVEYVDDVKWLPATVRFGRLLGGAGSGKSTALARIERFWAVPASEIPHSGETCWVPVRIRWDGTADPDRALQTALSRRGVLTVGGSTFRLECHQRLARCTFTELRRRLVSPVYVLVDGLDGLKAVSDDSSAGLASATLLTGGGLLIASRWGEPLDFGLPVTAEIKNATLRPLDVARIRDFVRTHRRELAERLLEPRRTAIRRLAATPEMLAFMCQTSYDTASLPDRLVDVVRSFVDARLQEVSGTRAELEEWLPTQALKVLRGPSRCVRVDDHQQDLVDAGKRARLLRDHPRGVLEFSSAIVSDYFAARQLLRKIDRVGPRKGIAELGTAPSAIKRRWRNCFAMLAALAESRSRAAIIDEIRRIDPMLASLCLAHEAAANAGASDLDETRHALEHLLTHGEDAPESKAEVADALGWLDPRVRALDPTAGLVAVGEEPLFWLARYPVTNLEYAHFVEDGGYRKRQYRSESAAVWLAQGIEGPEGWSDWAADRPNYPVTGVSFHEAVAYCRWLSARVGDRRFQLPSAAEWDRGAFPLDPVPHQRLSDWSFDARVALLARSLRQDQPLDRTSLLMEQGRELDALLTPIRDAVERHRSQLTCAEAMPVGVFSPNEIGLYDSIGGVWEWCDSGAQLDPLDRPSARQSALEGPVIAKGGPAPADFDPSRVILGGYFDPGTRFEQLGFRVSARRLH